MLFGQVYLLKHYNSIRGDSYGVYAYGDKLLLLISTDRVLIETLGGVLSPTLVGSGVVSITARIYEGRKTITLDIEKEISNPPPWLLKGLIFTRVTRELIDRLPKNPGCFRWESGVIVRNAPRLLVKP